MGWKGVTEGSGGLKKQYKALQKAILGFQGVSGVIVGQYLDVLAGRMQAALLVMKMNTHL